MAWTVEVSDEFAVWYGTLADDECESVNFSVDLLEELGPSLGRPHVDTVRESRHANMKELRVQHRGSPYRILFAFDPRRAAYLILGGDKTGDEDWYKVKIKRADQIYEKHLREIKGEHGEELERNS
ncbi:MAG: type II toxin-antitoxin system RelE/ParE family toxin [Terriglobales bacterium]